MANTPYILRDGKTYYVSGPSEDEAYKALKTALKAARKDNPQPTSILATAQWIPSDGKEPPYFAVYVTTAT